MCDAGPPTIAELSAPLSGVASRLADAGEWQRICAALESGRLHHDSTGPVRSGLAGGSPVVETELVALQKIWRRAPSIPGRAWSLALRSSIGTVLAVRAATDPPEIVWTGPTVEGSYLRSTHEVIRELLRTARREVLIVGYWISFGTGTADPIEEVVAALATAVSRGVRVTAVIDERRRRDGQDNRQLLLGAWPHDVPLPQLLTWRLPMDDQYVKLHAKVIVIDGSDALVTSANLTSYAMYRNIEMGVRVAGTPANRIRDHFQRLIRDGVIAEFERDRTS